MEEFQQKISSQTEKNEEVFALAKDLSMQQTPGNPQLRIREKGGIFWRDLI